jgi:hypothetical protein
MHSNTNTETRGQGEERVLGEFPKNARDKIRLSLEGHGEQTTLKLAVLKQGRVSGRAEMRVTHAIRMPAAIGAAVGATLIRGAKIASISRPNDSGEAQHAS